jgi:DNA invertase Pin-like site-specific DNA recombinase
MIDRIGKVETAFRSLGDTLWDTSIRRGDCCQRFWPRIANFERDLIRERTGEGRKRAMANGIKFGRKRKLSDYQWAEAIKASRRLREPYIDRQELWRRHLDDFRW